MVADVKEKTEETEAKTEAKTEEAEAVEEKKAEERKDIVEERFYTIPLRRAWIAIRPLRTPKAMKLIREYVSRHLKVEEVKIDGKLNQAVWRRSIEKPPARIRVRAVKDKEGVVTVYLVEKEKVVA